MVPLPVIPQIEAHLKWDLNKDLYFLENVFKLEASLFIKEKSRFCRISNKKYKIETVYSISQIIQNGNSSIFIILKKNIETNRDQQF